MTIFTHVWGTEMWAKDDGLYRAEMSENVLLHNLKCSPFWKKSFLKKKGCSIAPVRKLRWHGAAS